MTFGTSLIVYLIGSEVIGNTHICVYIYIYTGDL